MLIFVYISHPFTLTGYGSVKSTKPEEIIFLNLKKMFCYTVYNQMSIKIMKKLVL